MTTYWHDDLAAHPPVGAWMWHLHHGILCEPLTEPLQTRLNYIRVCKPEEEQETRLRLISPVDASKVVNDPLWDAYGKARDAYDKAWNVYYKAKDAYDKAWDVYYKAWDVYYKAKDAYDKAWDAYDKAKDAYDKAWGAYGKAWDVYYKAKNAILPLLASLHAEQCPNCPWNGRTIFP